MEQSVFYRETRFSSAMKYFQEMKHELITLVPMAILVSLGFSSHLCAQT
jgi:hypothetical protein